MLVLIVVACFAVACARADPIPTEGPPTISGNTAEEKVDFLMSKIEEQCARLDDDTGTGDEGEGRVKRQALSDPDELRAHLLTALLELRECRDKLNPTTAPPVAVTPSEDPCNSFITRNLTEWWRKDSLGSRYKPDDGDYACDRELQGNAIWFRFSGAGGTQLSNQCRPSFSCGGHGGFWSDAEMPTAVGEVKQVPIYGSWSGNCNWYTWPTRDALTVKRCSSQAGDFVYKVQGTSSCHWTFCGMAL